MKQLLTILFLFPILTFGQILYESNEGISEYPDFIFNTNFPQPAYVYRLSGSGQTMYEPDTSAYTIPSLGGTASLSIWFKTTATGSVNDFFYKGFTGPNSKGRYGITLFSDNKLYGVIEGTGAAKAGTGVAGFNDGNWHHVVYTFNTAGSHYLYVDDSLRSSESIVIGGHNYNVSLNKPLTIGCGFQNGFVYYFDGDIRDARLYNRQITADDVTTIYNGGILGDEYRWWIMHPDSAYDVSGSSEHLTKFGAITELGDASIQNPVNKYGFTQTDSIPFDASTIDDFGTATHDINGNELERKIVGEQPSYSFIVSELDYFVADVNSNYDLYIQNDTMTFVNASGDTIGRNTKYGIDDLCFFKIFNNGNILIGDVDSMWKSTDSLSTFTYLPLLDEDSVEYEWVGQLGNRYGLLNQPVSSNVDEGELFVWGNYTNVTTLSYGCSESFVYYSINGEFVRIALKSMPYWGNLGDTASPYLWRHIHTAVAAENDYWIVGTGDHDVTDTIGEVILLGGTYENYSFTFDTVITGTEATQVKLVGLQKVGNDIIWGSDATSSSLKRGIYKAHKDSIGNINSHTRLYEHDTELLDLQVINYSDNIYMFSEARVPVISDLFIYNNGQLLQYDVGIAPMRFLKKNDNLYYCDDKWMIDEDYEGSIKIEVIYE